MPSASDSRSSTGADGRDMVAFMAALALMLSSFEYIIPKPVPFLRLATRTSPNHDHEAYYYLSLAYLFAGENFNCKLALAELAYRYPCSERLDRLRAQIDRHRRVDKAGGSETLALNDSL